MDEGVGVTARSRLLGLASLLWGVLAGLFLWAVTVKAAVPGRLMSDSNAMQLLLMLAVLGGASGLLFRRYERQVTAIWSGAPMCMLLGVSAAELFSVGGTVSNLAGATLLLLCGQLILKISRVLFTAASPTS